MARRPVGPLFCRPWYDIKDVQGGKAMRTARLAASTALLAIVLVTAGCTTYYRVTDPSSGRMYYTTDISRRGTAVEFVDAKSGSNVTLQNSEVKEISSEDYQKNTAK
jgi:hypothetical protein